MSSFPCLLTPEEEHASGINWRLAAGESGHRSLATSPLLNNSQDVLEQANTASNPTLAQELSAKTNELADVRKALMEANQRIKELEKQPHHPPNALSRANTGKPSDQKALEEDKQMEPTSRQRDRKWTQAIFGRK
jgi:hypothetical protein